MPALRRLSLARNSLNMNDSNERRGSYGPADRLRNTVATPACRSLPPARKWHAAKGAAAKFLNGIKQLRPLSQLSPRLARGLLNRASRKDVWHASYDDFDFCDGGSCWPSVDERSRAGQGRILHSRRRLCDAQRR